jgi:hypothetical protein
MSRAVQPLDETAALPTIWSRESPAPAWNEGSLKHGPDGARAQRTPQSSFCAVWCAKTPDDPHSAAEAAVGGVLAPYGAQKLGRDAGPGGNWRNPPPETLLARLSAVLLSHPRAAFSAPIGVTLAEIAEIVVLPGRRSTSRSVQSKCRAKGCRLFASWSCRSNGSRWC